MKRSPATSSSSPSSSSSISSSGSDPNPRLEQKPKRERARRARSGGEPPNGDKHGSCGRSSTYRGVAKHRWTQRFEAHLWDKTSWHSSGSRRDVKGHTIASDTLFTTRPSTATRSIPDCGVIRSPDEADDLYGP